MTLCPLERIFDHLVDSSGNYVAILHGCGDANKFGSAAELLKSDGVEHARSTRIVKTGFYMKTFLNFKQIIRLMKPYANNLSPTEARSK